MSNPTLLQYVQMILSSMNSDEVNSIGDTAESLQVANAVQTAYMNLMGKFNLPEHNQLFNLQPSNDLNSPILMYLPDGVQNVQWIKYFDTNPEDSTNLQVDQFGAYSQHDVNTDLQANANGWSTTSITTNTINTGHVTFTVASGLAVLPGNSAFAFPNSSPNVYMQGTVVSYSGTTLVLNITFIQGAGTYSNWSINQNGPGVNQGPGYKTVEILPLDEFLKMVNTYAVEQFDVETMTLTINEDNTGLPQTFKFNYLNDIQPMYCTVLSNYYVIFNSYDNTQDSTLQSNKSMAFGWIVPPFLLKDTFVPNLDVQQVPLLLNEAKSLAFFEIKNQPHQKAEKEVLGQMAALQKWKSQANKPSYFEELPSFGRRGPGLYGWGRGLHGYGANEWIY